MGFLDSGGRQAKSNGGSVGRLVAAYVTTSDCAFRSRGLNRSVVGKTEISFTSGRPQQLAPLTLTSLLAWSRGARPRLFCDFELHGRASDHSLQFGDAVLVLAPLTLALEEAFQTFEGGVLPASDEFGLELVLPGDFGLATPAREDFENDLGFELGGEGSASALGHRRALLGDQY
jgi:hypothetical protein